jgi:hypothetical protein
MMAISPDASGCAPGQAIAASRCTEAETYSGDCPLSLRPGAAALGGMTSGANGATAFRSGPASAFLIANRRITPSDAASGIATSKPTKPNRYPKANSANISQTGLSLTRLPMIRGDST